MSRKPLDIYTFLALCGIFVFSLTYLRLFLELPTENTLISENHVPKSVKVNEPRIYCMIPTHIGQTKLWRAIMLSYGDKCDVLRFSIDPLTHEEEIKYIDGVVEGLTFHRYPKSRKTQKDNILFDVESSNGFKTQVMIIPMVRRKPYFNLNAKLERDLASQSFGSPSKFNSTFHKRYKSIGICADKKPCRHIWEKVWRSFAFIAGREIERADFFLKVDDDTLLIPGNLRKYIKSNNLLPNENHYFGHRAFSSPLYFISGVCSVFSRAAVIAMTDRYKKMDHEYGSRKNFPNSHGICVDRDGATEERATSKCLQDVNIEPFLAAEKITNRFQHGNLNFYNAFIPPEAKIDTGLSDEESKTKRDEFLSMLLEDISVISGAPQYYTPENLDGKDLENNFLLADLVIPLGLPFTLTYKNKKTSTSWYWKEKEINRGDMLNCCSYNAFAIHGYKSSQRMTKFADYLYRKPIEEVMAALARNKLGSEEWYYMFFILKLKQNFLDS